MTSACGSSEPPKDECIDGVVNPETGACEGKCTPDKCVADNTCVGNRCLLKCDSHLDCYRDGTQDCAPAKEDDTEADIFVCTGTSKVFAVGFGCAFGTECNAFGVCPSGESCNLAQCNGQPDACVKDVEACGDDQACTLGKCADASPCTINPCAAAQCTKLVCLSEGIGDANSYCTKPACSTDDECPGGFYCGLTRDPHELCGSSPQKGNSTLCGETDEACVEASTLGMGNSLSEGSRCILRKTCLKREQCAPCKSDLDCSQVAAQKCVTVGGEGRCLRGCAANKDCDPDYECSPEGSCVPQAGVCVGKGGFCEPCLNDADCGDATTSKICFEFSGGQKACIDTSVTCTMDSDCPKSPGNDKFGYCSGEVCVPPIVGSGLSCW